jgi:hypothetical protein
MRRALTVALCLTLAALAAAAVLVRLFGDLPAALDTLARGDEVGARTEEATRAADRRGSAKARAVEDALAGRLSLLEAAAVHRDLDAGLPPGQRDAWRLCADGATEEERYCRGVLLQARTLAEGRPKAEAAVTRLRRQLEEALAAGDLRLLGPDAPGVP